MAKTPVKITETVLRDGHQSLAATRMRITDMIPMLEQLDDMGYHSLEAWGGATFDSCLRFLNEDPWERLRTLKRYLPKTPIQMLLRGQNILGYNHYADDVVTEFVKRMVDAGIGIIRVFDALNDPRNLETSFKAAAGTGAHVQGAIVYTISPYHNTESFLKIGREMVQMGAQSICIKDMSGMIKPYIAYDLVKALKEDTSINVPIQLHSHYTSGMASMAYLKAIEAGVDIIDCALSPFALGTSQPCTESMIAALEGTERDTGLNRAKLQDAVKHFATVKKSLGEDFNLKTHFDVDVNVLDFQIPGGMLSNLYNQLKEQGIEDKYGELLEEMPRVRADMGYPPLVTPTSQIVGSMATFNVMLGERYKIVPREVKDIARGKYGKTPVEVSQEILDKMGIDASDIIRHRPADDIAPQLESLKAALAEKGYPNASMEDILSYAVFPDVALDFFAKNR